MSQAMSWLIIAGAAVLGTGIGLVLAKAAARGDRWGSGHDSDIDYWVDSFEQWEDEVEPPGPVDVVRSTDWEQPSRSRKAPGTAREPRRDQ
jgi:hypothetical protein